VPLGLLRRGLIRGRLRARSHRAANMADVLHLILQKSLHLHQNDLMESPALVHRKWTRRSTYRMKPDWDFMATVFLHLNPEASQKNWGDEMAPARATFPRKILDLAKLKHNTDN
jgi:hypothetical protein